MSQQSAWFQRDFGYRIALISRRLRRVMDHEIRGWGLTEATWRPLTYIRQMGNGVRQKDLALALGIEGPSLVALLGNLQAKGLIERKTDPRDRRAYEVHMTEAGRNLCESIGQVSARAHAAMFEGIPAADQAVCMRALARMEQALDALLASVQDDRAREAEAMVRLPRRRTGPAEGAVARATLSHRS